VGGKACFAVHLVLSGCVRKWLRYPWLLYILVQNGVVLAKVHFVVTLGGCSLRGVGIYWPFERKKLTKGNLKGPPSGSTSTKYLRASVAGYKAVSFNHYLGDVKAVALGSTTLTFQA